ncbi:dihydrolipoyl dehydrogenase [Desulfopila sp. IMCC35006]|uniref:dihydrolipoyl dehydrogenase n=1 Tax=Desulfopila sp. IMCC35006 TaxID=2569542 RepID=UPI0010ADA49F|nr:dihydrolipoyl dehydrogenase [Desulfopila sp. IMCC35006]TKB25605.1 dihydrolipoyl dehydrogenase [Desulfopila sp. IMCC35006]
MSESKTYDVVVLGGGPGGYTAAFRAADLGLSVCLVEKQPRLGGVCLNVGCIPSKTLLHAATVIEEAAEIAEFGVDFAPPKVDITRVLAKKNAVIEQLTSGLDGLCKARKITRLSGIGVFKDTTTLLVTGADGEQQVKFTNAIIATGSHPFKLPNIPDDPRIWDSTAALDLQLVPKRFLIIGGGIIGLEMAQIYSAFGSEITIVEMLDQIIPPADKDLVQPLFLKLKKKYTILTKTKVTAVTPAKGGIKVSLAGKDVPENAEFDAVLVAVGRKPNTADIGFETIGLAMDERGFLLVNERQQTNVANFYGVGDVVGEPMLAHKATHEAKVAAEVIAGHKSAFTPMTIPSVAYTNPEVAWMGLTEKEAKNQNIDFDKGKFPWGASGRALSAGASSGVTKALFDKKTGRIIGAGICGQNAGELIHEAVLALEMGANAEDIGLTVHAHPTLAETFAFAAEIVDGSITDVLPPKKK